MPHGIFQSWRGELGTIKIPTIGATIGIMSRWTLTLRGGDEAKHNVYDLRASFSMINEHMFNDPDYVKYRQIDLTLGPKQLRIRQVDGEETVLRDRTLLMKGVFFDVQDRNRRSDRSPR